MKKGVLYDKPTDTARINIKWQEMSRVESESNLLLKQINNWNAVY